MVVAVKEMEVLIQPVEAAVRAEAEKTRGKEPKEQGILLWIEIRLDWDYGMYFRTEERKTGRKQNS